MSAELRALVVYESMFGNTETVAECVAEGLRLDNVEVEVTEVGQAPMTLPEDVDLLVVGAPTHAFSLSRPGTRADAVRQGAPQARQQLGLREWLAAVVPPHRKLAVAAFDTRVAKVRRLPKAAGPRAAKLARRRGFMLLTRPAAFCVDDIKGPLAEQEPEHAVEWGRLLAGITRLHADAATAMAALKGS